jgi:hypothetical protein
MFSSDGKLPSLVHIVLPGLGCQSILSSHDVGDGEGAGVTRGDNGDKLGEGVGFIVGFFVTIGTDSIGLEVGEDVEQISSNSQTAVPKTVLQHSSRDS